MAKGKQTCKILKEIRKQATVSELARNARPKCAIWSVNWRNGNEWAKRRL